MSYLTPQDVEKQIGDDYDKFMMAQYKDENLPDNLMQVFASALMHIVPKNYNLHTEQTRKLLAKHKDDLLFGEVGIVLNIITDVPYHNLYSSLNEALDAQGNIERITIRYNTTINKFRSDTEKKQQRLMQLVNKSHVLQPR